MNRKEKIADHVLSIADEVLGYIKENESRFDDRWVPSTEITKELGLKYVCVPIKNKPQGTRDWLLGITARILEERGDAEHSKIASRAYYRSK